MPSAGNPQALNRYAYVYNNPLKHIDVAGHIPLLATAAIGGVIGGTISIVSQMRTAMKSGRAQTYQEAWQSVDPAKVAGATVAGAVAGATMGLVAPAVASSVLPGLAASGASSAAVHTVGLGISIGAGGLSGIAGGRAGAITEGVVAEGLASHKDGTSWNLATAYQGACTSGLWSGIQKDAIIGGAGGAFGYTAQTLSSAIGFVPKPQWRLQVHPDRINYARQFMTQQQVATVAGAEVINEIAGNIIQSSVENGINPYYK